jgi:hypothetical protein
MREGVDSIFTPPATARGKMKIILKLRSGSEIFLKKLVAGGLL